MTTLRLTDEVASLNGIEARPRGGVWDAEGLQEAVGTLLREESPPARLTIELDGSVAQVRRLSEVPPVRGSRLGPLLSLQAGRLFRRSREPLTISGAWIDRRSGLAIACAVPETWLESLVTAVAARGATVTTIRVADRQPSPELVPPSLRASRVRQARRTTRRTMIGVVGIWLMAGIAYVADLARDQRAIAEELAAMEAPLEELSRARATLSRVDSIDRGLEPLAGDRWSAIRTWARLVEALPAEAEIEVLTLERSGRHRLEGRAPDHAAVLAALESSSFFTSASLDERAGLEDSASGTFSITLLEVMSESP